MVDAESKLNVKQKEIGSDTCQESTESGEDPFSLVKFFCCLSGKTNPKMPLYLLYVPLWKLSLHSNMEKFSALSFSSRTKRGLWRGRSVNKRENNT